jgi:hypothetical protein
MESFIFLMGESIVFEIATVTMMDRTIPTIKITGARYFIPSDEAIQRNTRKIHVVNGIRKILFDILIDVSDSIIINTLFQIRF